MTQTVQMTIAGMTCTHCEERVEHALAAAGASDVHADFRCGQATFHWPAHHPLAAAEQAIRDAGYHPGHLEVLAVEPAAPTECAAPGGGYDLAILGSGAAAFAAAIRAREAGAQVVMIERGTLGGTCVNTGCVPSKALLAAAELYWKAGHSPFAGVSTAAVGVDLAALVAQKEELIEQLRAEKYADVLTAYGWTLLQGQASFADADTLLVNGEPLHADQYLIATGSSPAIPAIAGLQEAGYLTSTTALELTELPESLVVIGANAIGLELGQLFLHLGSAVTFIELLDRIAPFEEPEISAELTDVLQGQGAEVLTSAAITRIERRGEERLVHVEVAGVERLIRATQIVVATGRRPNTRGLGLERAAIASDERGAIVVDDTLRTTNRRVWAAGDVTGAPQYVYVAAYEGALAADNIVHGANRKVDLSALPRVTFTTPQLASVGLTETAAREAGYRVKTSLLPLSTVPRALVNHQPHGLFKLVADEATDRLLGIHALAENAGEVIYAGVLAIKGALTVADLVDTFCPYLTMAEGIKLAAQAFGRDVTKLSCCAA
jgi:mercuric reductase